YCLRSTCFSARCRLSGLACLFDAFTTVVKAIMMECRMKRQRESEIAMGDALEGDFRKAMRTLASAVSIVSTAHDDRRFGMTATAVCSLSMQPPTLLVCVNQSTSLHHPLLNAGRFCINILMPTRTSWREPSAKKVLKTASRAAIGRWM